MLGVVGEQESSEREGPGRQTSPILFPSSEFPRGQSSFKLKHNNHTLRNKCIDKFAIV